VKGERKRELVRYVVGGLEGSQLASTTKGGQMPKGKHRMALLERVDEAARLIVAYVLVMALCASLTLLGFSAGEQYVRSHPVCQAVQEDSTITGCDYHDGAWWVIDPDATQYRLHRKV
jgi:hypothetical protein